MGTLSVGSDLYICPGARRSLRQSTMDKAMPSHALCTLKNESGSNQHLEDLRL